MDDMYLLDANTYIQAKNIYYQLDFCPAYWHFLDQQLQLGFSGVLKMSMMNSALLGMSLLAG